MLPSWYQKLTKSDFANANDANTTGIHDWKSNYRSVVRSAKVPIGMKRNGGKVPKPKHSIDYYKDEAGEWRSRIRHSNGNIILDSAEGYKRIDKAISAMNNFIDDIVSNAGLIPMTVDRNLGKEKETAEDSWQDAPNVASTQEKSEATLPTE